MVLAYAQVEAGFREERVDPDPVLRLVHSIKESEPDQGSELDGKILLAGVRRRMFFGNPWPLQQALEAMSARISGLGRILGPYGCRFESKTPHIKFEATDGGEGFSIEGYIGGELGKRRDGYRIAEITRPFWTPEGMVVGMFRSGPQSDGEGHCLTGYALVDESLLGLPDQPDHFFAALDLTPHDDLTVTDLLADYM